MGMLVTIGTVQLTLPYLGVDRFGAWMLLASLIAMLSFLDLGVGNALTNRTAAAAATGEADHLRHVVSGGLVALLFISALSVVLLASVSWLVPWSTLLRTSSGALIDEVSTASLVFAVCFGVFLFSGGVQKVFLGIQRSFEAHLAVASSSAVVLLMLYIAARNQAGIPTLLAITASGQALTALVLTTLLLTRGQFRLPGAAQAARTQMPALLKVGGPFLVLQIGTMVGWGADSLIVSATLGSAEVAVYAVAQRLFLFATLPAAMLNQPLWGAYADAHARHAHGFIGRTLRLSLGLTAAGTFLLATMLVLGQEPIIAAWTKHTLAIPLAFLVLFAVWAVIEAVATAASMYMNGCSVIRPQVFAVIVFCALSIPLKLVLANHWGLAGVVAGTIIAYIVAVPVLYVLFFRAEVSAPLRTSVHESHSI